MTMATTYDNLTDRDFGNDGVSESPFGMDKGAGGTAVRTRSLGLRGQATDKLRGVADQGKEHVASSLDGLVTAAREIANKLQDGSFGPIGGYATSAADTLEGWTQAVRDKSIDDLIDDGRELVRTQPAIAIGLAVAAGFALTRFLRAGGRGY